MTPKVIAGWMAFAADDEKQESAKLLSLHAMAARGDPKVVKSRIKEWSKE